MRASCARVSSTGESSRRCRRSEVSVRVAKRSGSLMAPAYNAGVGLGVVAASGPGFRADRALRLVRLAAHRLRLRAAARGHTLARAVELPLARVRAQRGAVLLGA